MADRHPRTVLGLLILAVPVLFMPGRAAAQSDGDSFAIGTWREIESKVLDEKRRIIVSKPRGYDASVTRYPVLYLLDGPGHFHHTTGLIEFMSGNDVMPRMLVVAIANTDRTRDLTPRPRDAVPAFRSAGGADKFITFLRDELVPFIDKEYRTTPYRVLVGHSFGGLFAIHTLVHQGDLFDAYIAISPSLQWDGQALVGQAEEFFDKTGELNKALYMTTGNEGGALLGGVLKLAGILEEKSPRGFEWDSRVMKEETHGTVPHRSTRQGLEFVFKNWGVRDPMAVYGVGGVEAIHEHYRKASEKFGVKREAPGSLFRQVAFRLAAAGKMKEAWAVVEHDPERYPPAARVYIVFGNMCENADDKKGAIECYKRALELDPDSEPAKAALKKLGDED